MKASSGTSQFIRYTEGQQDGLCFEYPDNASLINTPRRATFKSEPFIAVFVFGSSRSPDVLGVVEQRRRPMGAIRELTH